METKKRLEDGKLVIESAIAEIKIPLQELFDDLNDEEKMEAAAALTWGPVMNEAIDRLTGQSVSWGGDDELLTLEVLSRMEKKLTSGYKWNMLRNLDRLAKDLVAHNHIYWKLYHSANEHIRAWMEENDIESNYTGKFQEYEDFRAWVEGFFAELRQGIKGDEAERQMEEVMLYGTEG